MISTYLQTPFETLCPEWNKTLQIKDISQDEHKVIKKLMGDATTCIVGEAFKGNDEYFNDCYECWEYAVKFNSIVNSDKPNPDPEDFRLVRTDEIQQLIPEFVNHFNEVHM